MARQRLQRAAHRGRELARACPPTCEWHDKANTYSRHACETRGRLHHPGMTPCQANHGAEVSVNSDLVQRSTGKRRRARRPCSETPGCWRLRAPRRSMARCSAGPHTSVAERQARPSTASHRAMPPVKPSGHQLERAQRFALNLLCASDACSLPTDAAMLVCMRGVWRSGSWCPLHAGL